MRGKIVIGISIIAMIVAFVIVYSLYLFSTEHDRFDVHSIDCGGFFIHRDWNSPGTVDWKWRYVSETDIYKDSGTVRIKIDQHHRVQHEYMTSLGVYEIFIDGRSFQKTYKDTIVCPE